MPEIYHVVRRAAWESGRSSGAFEGESLGAEGFLHCCTAEQLPGVLARYFRGVPGLVALRIETTSLRSPLLWESPPGSSEDFPHLYGPLNVDAVVSADSIEAPPAGAS